MSEINGVQVPNVGEVVLPVVNSTPTSTPTSIPVSTPVSSVQSSPVAKKNNPTLVFVAIGAVVLLIGIIAVVVIVVLNGNKAAGVSFKTHDTSSLGKVVDSTYTFYYPKAYVKSSTSASSELLQNYQATEENALGGYNGINLTASSEETVIEKQSDCKVVGTSMVSYYVSEFGVDTSDVTNLASDLINQNNMIGCDLRFKVRVLGTDFFIDQVLFTKKGLTTTYVVSASSDKGSGSQYDEIRAAVESFSIK
jgi:hypothetical protein